MKCDICRSETATVHLQETTNGMKRTAHMCTNCASSMKTGASLAFSLSNMFADMMGMDTGFFPDPSGAEPSSCGTCGMTGAELHNIGLVGCEDCYDAFADIILDGDPPEKLEDDKAFSTIKLKKSKKPKADPVEALEKKLGEAVNREDYEQAAELRDKIAAMTIEVDDD